jgi:hypothetical protein
MISVLMECADEEEALAATLMALVPGAVEGLISDVTLVDRGLVPATRMVADAAGCRLAQPDELDQAVSAARGEWLLLLQPGSIPEPGWIDQVGHHVAHDRRPARFACARASRGSLLNRIRLLRPGLALGLLLPKAAAQVALAQTGSLRGVAEIVKPGRLDAALRPASARR